jgi:hypothetical protein
MTVPLNDRCCGESGTLATTRPDISTQVRFRKEQELRKGAAALRADGFDGDVKVLTSCPSCLQGLSRFDDDAATKADYIVVEIAKHLLGPDWMADYVAKRTAEASSACWSDGASPGGAGAGTSNPADLLYNSEAMIEPPLPGIRPRTRRPGRMSFVPSPSPTSTPQSAGRAGCRSRTSRSSARPVLGQLKALGATTFPPRERATIAEVLRDLIAHLHTELARRYAGKGQPARDRETDAAEQAIALWQGLWEQYSTCLKPLWKAIPICKASSRRSSSAGSYVGKQLVVTHGSRAAPCRATSGTSSTRTTGWPRCWNAR